MCIIAKLVINVLGTGAYMAFRGTAKAFEVADSVKGILPCNSNKPKEKVNNNRVVCVVNS